ncbi:MAG TPA: type II toxin-antitoxin system VapC family toxin [Nocardioidaceae bacterium]|nr:type II toxin-antitoxin system VapC family toxin [Nocardioidaceae bacterium]
MYLDTSAAVKLLVEEAESVAFARLMDDPQTTWVSSVLLECEMRRFAVRHDLPQVEVTDVLDAVSLYDMPRSLFYEAGILAGKTLRSLDALHLVSSIRIGADAVATYDARMQEAAGDLGLTVVAVP